MQRSLTRSMVPLSMTSAEISVDTSGEIGGASLISTYKNIEISTEVIVRKKLESICNGRAQVNAILAKCQLMAAKETTDFHRKKTACKVLTYACIKHARKQLRLKPLEALTLITHDTVVAQQTIYLHF